MKAPASRERPDDYERPAPQPGCAPAVAEVLALQRSAGNHAVTRALAEAAVAPGGRQAAARPHGRAAVARQPTGAAAPTPSNDDIAREFGAADWEAFKAERQAASDTVFGQPVTGLLPVFLEKLRGAEAAVAQSQNGGQPITADQWRTRFGVTSVGGLRFNASGGPASTHGWGLAIDLNYRGAPYVMHEAREQTLDAQLAPVYHRIAWLILYRQSVIPEAITRVARSEDTRTWHRALRAESDAMRRYFQMMRDPNDIHWNTVYEDMTNEIWGHLGVGAMPNPGDPQRAQVEVRELLRRQMAQDYAVLGGPATADVGGGLATPALPAVQRAGGGAADRPFVGRDPGEGFMDIHEEVAAALRAQSGVRWGAIDFGGESGDVMHFDLRGHLEAKRAAAARALQQNPGATLARTARLVQRQPTQAQEREAMRRTDLGIRVTTGTTAELQAEQARLEAIVNTEYSTLTESEAAELSRSLQRLRVLLAERGNSTLADAGVELRFNGSELRMVGSAVETFAGVSGRPGAGGRFDYSPERQRQENVGPIPEGVYWIDPRQLKDLWYYALSDEASAAWGSHRITVHPFDTTATFGRGGFFIHGGTTPGSAGCIDLTSGMARFAALISAVPPGQKVKLHVAYPTVGDFPQPQGDTRPA